MLSRRQNARTPYAVVLLALTLLGSALVTSSASADPLRPLPLPPLPTQPPDARPKVDRTVKMATLNILGSNHTQGDDHNRSVRTARLIKRRDLDLVGLQEVQDDQLAVLDNRLRHYRIWPKESLGNNGIRLQIAFRKKVFELKDEGTITTTFSHQQRPIPWVRLKDRRTGRQFYFVTIHNSPLGQESDRDEATHEEIRLYRQLRDSGKATMVVGDANERFEFFCKLAGRTDAVAANGGKATRRRCQPPEHASIDWLMGGGSFDFRDYRRHETSVSDHDLHTTIVRWSRG